MRESYRIREGRAHPVCQPHSKVSADPPLRLTRVRVLDVAGGQLGRLAAVLRAGLNIAAALDGSALAHIAPQSRPIRRERPPDTGALPTVVLDGDALRCRRAMAHGLAPTVAVAPRRVRLAEGDSIEGSGDRGGGGAESDGQGGEDGEVHCREGGVVVV